MHEKAISEIADKRLKDGDEIALGQSRFKVLYSPGHTDDTISIYGEGMIFTADVLLIESVGRTDFQNGLTVIVPGLIPWSHGLFMSLIWSILFAMVAYLAFKDRRTSVVLGVVVFSHWILDFIVHPGELPLLFKGSSTVGLGLWTSGIGLMFSIILELALLAGGVAIYLVARKRNAETWHI